MSLKEKFNRFFEENGLQKQWFAKKIGINREAFYQIINGHHTLPEKYWKKVIEITKGQITLGDIMGDRLKDIEDLEVKNTGDPERCNLSLKVFNRDR